MSDTAPLTPPGCDLRDFPGMLLNIARLRGSSFDATTNDTAWRAGLNLWMSSFHSIPAGSLENDEERLAAAAGLSRDLRTWKKVRTIAMRGWRLCSDGRLYHPVVSEVALEAWLERLLARLNSGVGNKVRWNVDFDAAAAEAEIRSVCELLRALNPQSRALAKVLRKLNRRGSKPTANGDQDDDEPDNRPDIRTDNKNVRTDIPSESQLKLKQKQDISPSLRSGDISGQHSARAGEPEPPEKLPSETDTALWASRLDDLHAAVKAGLNLASPGVHHARDLKALTRLEPPCDWENHIRPAVIAVCASMAERGDPLGSFAYPAIRKWAVKLRDQAANPENLDDRPRHANGAGNGARDRSEPGGMLGALMRAEARDAAEPRGAGSDSGGDPDIVEAEFSRRDPAAPRIA